MKLRSIIFTLLWLLLGECGASSACFTPLPSDLNQLYVRNLATTIQSFRQNGTHDPIPFQVHYPGGWFSLVYLPKLNRVRLADFPGAKAQRPLGHEFEQSAMVFDATIDNLSKAYFKRGNWEMWFADTFGTRSNYLEYLYLVARPGADTKEIVTQRLAHGLRAWCRSLNPNSPGAGITAKGEGCQIFATWIAKTDLIFVECYDTKDLPPHAQELILEEPDSHSLFFCRLNEKKADVFVRGAWEMDIYAALKHPEAAVFK